MDEILHDLSTPALVRAIEANQFALWRDRARLPWIELHEESDRLWVASRSPLHATNCVLCAAWDDAVGEHIEATLDLFRARHVPMAWWIGPSSRPPNLGGYLRAHGLTLIVDEPGMAADLAAMELEAPEPAEFTLLRVGDKRALRQWMKTFSTAFSVPRSIHRVILEMEAELGFSREQARQLYLGLWRGKPVATTLLLLGAGVAGLYGVGTIPRARGRGIGTAMTLATLREARGRGYRVGILYASAMGRPLYRRLGFREYLMVQQYAWGG